MKNLFLMLVLFSLGISCTKKNSSQNPLIQKGRAVYQAQCTACHATDPKKDGALGPAIVGSSLELLTTRIKTATYPAGYTPKRNTKLMVAMPQVSNEDISAIHAYLNEK